MTGFREINPDGSTKDTRPPAAWPGTSAEYTRYQAALDAGCDGKMHCRPNTVQCTNHAQLKEPLILHYAHFVSLRRGVYIVNEFTDGPAITMEQYQEGQAAPFIEQALYGGRRNG